MADLALWAEIVVHRQLLIYKSEFVDCSINYLLSRYFIVSAGLMA